MTVVERVSAPDLTEALTPLVARAADRHRATLVSATVPVAPVDPISLYGMAQTLGASLWLQPDAGVVFVGIGEAWAAQQLHQGRFEVVSVAWQALIDDAIVEVGNTPRETGPLLLGGFSFDEEPVASETWDGFETGCMTLPALLLSSTPEGSWLTASMMVEPDGVPRGATVQSLDRTWASLADAPVLPPEPARQSLVVRRRTPDAVSWRGSVARLAGAVGRGRLDKAVLSREITLQASSDIDVTGVLRRLEASAPESTIFAFTRGSRTFLGATPERLVSLHGRELRTMAMAGSAPRAIDATEDDALADQLLASDKEREEHEVVVQMLREALAPVAVELDIPRRPEVVRFRHVQHLLTPVSGRLTDDADVLTLVERLHPTPAVGGTPRGLALELIAEEEPHERGWYAGPLGWIGRDGDGEFVVALRSGVIDGAEATLYAGCGIVADSDPEREWDESSAKLQALGSALGAFEP